VKADREIEEKRVSGLTQIVNGGCLADRDNILTQLGGALQTFTAWQASLAGL
jgi:hypothetical protein